MARKNNGQKSRQSASAQKTKNRIRSEAEKKAIRRYYANRSNLKYHVSAPYPHFRYYKPSGHPALIVGEHSDEEYKYRKVMHSEKDGRHLNEKVYPNPNPRDPKPMFIAKRELVSEKGKFENIPLPWKYPKKK